jgi:hypothetical protein
VTDKKYVETPQISGATVPGTQNFIHPCVSLVFISIFIKFSYSNLYLDYHT